MLVRLSTYSKVSYQRPMSNVGFRKSNVECVPAQNSLHVPTRAHFFLSLIASLDLRFFSYLPVHLTLCNSPEPNNFRIYFKAASDEGNILTTNIPLSSALSTKQSNNGIVSHLQPYPPSYEAFKRIIHSVQRQWLLSIIASRQILTSQFSSLPATALLKR